MINTPHPGSFIRENLIPKKLSVKDAALQLGVGRPALSNLLNGKADLSPEMAARIEKAFGTAKGITALELMDKQAIYDATKANRTSLAAFVKPYVPPYLQFKANDIISWSHHNVASRTRFAVLLRQLIHSTGLGLTTVQFHGNDDAERPGWDGFIETLQANPWIPEGKSGWEFGTNEEPKGKADDDFDKSVKQVNPKERRDITFIFVTPKLWSEKYKWVVGKKKEGKWKDVRVFDASDLEQWLEQSLPTQTWFAHEVKQPNNEVKSLDACWQEWLADCGSTLECFQFDDFAGQREEILLKKLTGKPDSVSITADSILEALAFLACRISSINPAFVGIRDRIIVFHTADALKKLIGKSVHFIPVITNSEVEKALAPYLSSVRSIIIRPRNASVSKSDITLTPLPFSSFEKPLQSIQVNRDTIHRLFNTSGGSLTVLRRRLSTLDAIKTPHWAQSQELAKALIPLVLAGAWKTNNPNDQTVLSMLADTTYEEMERNVAKLYQLEDSPVWRAGQFCGAISSMDGLFAISKFVIWRDLENFLEVARHLVLSEDDPALDLPENQRYAAALYGKTRNISSALRDGMAEMLVLLAVHGNHLFPDLGKDVSVHIDMFVGNLLTPLTSRVLEAQSADLPLYAEAAPNQFLNILENDLTTEDPQSLHLMRPASTDLFASRCPRTGLLWALETLAWSPKWLQRTVLILGRLSEVEINDNWVNKPKASLSAIFRSWLPQTAAPIDVRKAALQLLAKKFPKVAWNIYLEQFNGNSTTGGYSHKPRWSDYAFGHGERATNQEWADFIRHSFEIALAWPNHDLRTLSDLVVATSQFDENEQDKIWTIIEKWAVSASDQEKAVLREKVRTNCFTGFAKRKRLRNGRGPEIASRAKEIFDLLQPSSLQLKHSWLFAQYHVDLSWEETHDDHMDYDKRAELIRDARIKALQEIHKVEGLEGIWKLFGDGISERVVGLTLGQIFTSEHEFTAALAQISELKELHPHFKEYLIGALGYLSREQFDTIVLELVQDKTALEAVSILKLCPCEAKTWTVVNRLSLEVQDQYWKGVEIPQWAHSTPEELHLAVNNLINARRPLAAFKLIHMQSEKIPPQQLLQVLKLMGSGNENSNTFPVESYYLKKALEVMNESGEISQDDMAGIEFKFISVLDLEKNAIPNLEAQIAANPEMFVHAIIFTYKRDDGKEDAEEFHLTDREQLERRALAGYRLLEKLSRIPGQDQFGNIQGNELENWIIQVRQSCQEVGRLKVCDMAVGKLLSHAPEENDDLWPCSAVRDVIEKFYNPEIAQGITIALFNSRGVHSWGPGGDQERNLASKYRLWANAVEYSHPNVFCILMEMVKRYEREAKRNDEEETVRQRLR